jgi:tetratricopeptide (TPR) repeat protein
VPRKPSTHVDDPAAVGIRLKRAREAAGLTQSQLASEVCSKTYLSRVESGQRIPSLQLLRAWAERLGTTAEHLATGAAPTADADPLFDAELAARTGDLPGARSLYEKARRRGSPLLATRAEAALGRLAFEAGDHEEAVDWLEQAESSAVLPLGDANGVRDLLGRALALLARFDESLSVLERGLAEARAADDEPATLRFSVLLANLLIDRGNPGRAEETLSGVLSAARSAQDPVARSNLYWSQARLHASQGRQDLAARYARMAHATLESTEHTVYAARALSLLAHIENDRGNFADALELVDEGAPVLAAAGNRYDEGMLLLEKARALAALGQREEAASIALGATPRFEHAHPTSAARGYAIAADIFRALDEPDRALELYELAVETLPVTDRHLADIYQSISEIHEAAGRQEEAMAYLKRALDAQKQARRP